MSTQHVVQHIDTPLTGQSRLNFLVYNHVDANPTLGSSLEQVVEAVPLIAGRGPAKV
jgi:hypothetical protein